MGDATADRSQSEVLGFGLLVGLTLLTVSGVVIFGGAALDDARHATETQFAEQALSQFDSEASLVALGRSESRRVDLGRVRGGTYRIHENTGWLRVKHLNYSGPGTSHVLHNTTLGSLAYHNGDTVIAYQGGGVWHSVGESSAMVSPPEIYYQGTTLVLPIVRVAGDGQRTSRPTVLVREGSPFQRIYPNSSAVYPDDSNYSNPVQNGTIRLTVHSDYYEGWAAYFRSRTAGTVNVSDANETVTVELVAPKYIGDFGFPTDGNAISLRGMSDGHAIKNFTVTLSPDDVDRANFANMDWSLVAENAGRRFEFNVQSAGGKPCGSGNLDVRLTYERAGETYTWTNDSAFVENGTGAYTYSCGDGPRLHINFTGDTALTYGPGQADVTFDDHPADDGRTFSSGESNRTGFLVNHYLAFFDSSVDLEIQDGQTGNQGNAAGSVNEAESIGYIDYDASGQAITFLHVTENEVRLEFT